MNSVYDSEVVKPLYNNIWMFDPILGEASDPNRKGECRCLCPTCEYNGEPNAKYTMYWNEDKLEGFCHRCSAKFILMSDKSAEEVSLELAIRGYAKSTKARDDYIKSLKSLNNISYFKTFKPASDKCKSYLENRNPLITPLMNYLAIRELPGIGVAVPLTYDHKVVGYNLRYYNPRGKMKYYIPEGDKLIYSPNQVFYNLSKVDEITIVEGYFDAIAAFLDGFPNPLAIQGIYITDLQLQMIRKLMPGVVNVYLDKKEEGNKMRYRLYNNLPTISRVNVFKTWGTVRS